MVDLASLIEETTKKQEESLADFKDYINQSTELKASVGELNSGQEEFVYKVLENFAGGTASTEPLPSDVVLKAMWKILLNNKAYIVKLSAVVLSKPSEIEYGTNQYAMDVIEHYFKSIENYMENVEQKMNVSLSS